MHVLNRAQLIDDAFNLARSGQLSYTILLDLIEYIKQEFDYAPLHSFFRGLENLDRNLINTEVYKDFQEFVVDHLQTAYNFFGVELVQNETATDIFTKINTIKWLCLYGDEHCQSRMNEQLSREEQIHPNLQTNVYCGGMRIGDINNWHYLYQLYISNTTEEGEKERLLAALGCSLDRVILERYKAFDYIYIKMQFKIFCFADTSAPLLVWKTIIHLIHLTFPAFLQQYTQEAMLDSMLHLISS